MPRPLQSLVPAILLFAGAAQAAFELDDLEAWLPFSNHRGLAGNPAELAAVDCPRWELKQHFPFGLRQLSHNSLAVALPLQGLHLGAGLGSTGFALHRELSAWLGGGLELGRHLALGFSVTALYLQQETRTSRGRKQILGLKLNLGNGLELGLWHQGANALAPSRFFVKLVHRPDTRSAVYGHLRQQPTRSRRLDLAAEHQVHPRLHLYLGTRSTPRRFALGTRVFAGGLPINYAAVTHARLGPSHTLGTGNTCKSP